MARRRGKYGAKKTMRDGILFDSIWEADRYSQLQLLERAGHISELTVCKGNVGKFSLHDPYRSERTGKKVKAATYQPDFFYKDDLGKLIYEDAKGARRRESVLKRKIIEARYRITIWFVYRDGRRE